LRQGIEIFVHLETRYGVMSGNQTLTLIYIYGDQILIHEYIWRYPIETRVHMETRYLDICEYVVQIFEHISIRISDTETLVDINIGPSGVTHHDINITLYEYNFTFLEYYFTLYAFNLNTLF